MFDLGAMVAVTAAFFIVTVSSGPANVTVATVSMAFGRQAGLRVGLGAQDGYTNLVVATLVCMTVGFANYAGHALLFSLSGFMAGYKRARGWIEGVVATLFAAAGFGLVRSAISR